MGIEPQPVDPVPARVYQFAMILLLSPAKTLDYASPLPELSPTVPRFADEALTTAQAASKLSARKLGKLMSIHAARIRRNIAFAEDDRYHTHAFDASDYLFRDGQWHAPDAPGWGVRLVDYDRFVRQGEELEIR